MAKVQVNLADKAGIIDCWCTGDLDVEDSATPAQSLAVEIMEFVADKMDNPPILRSQLECNLRDIKE